MAQLSIPSRAWVCFVGLGPGVPSLLTVAAIEAISHADRVLLASPEQREVLEEAGVDVREYGQLDVEADFVGQVREGEHLAVLVDGDPFLNGPTAVRARESAEAGLSIDVIPGVPMRTSLPEFAGVSLSDPQVHLVTLDEDEDEGEQLTAEWAAEGTVVVLGPAGAMTTITERAVEAGRRPEEPAVVTVHGGSTAQLTRATTVAELSGVVTELPVSERAFVVAVIGPRADDDVRQSLNWFETKSLFGWRVLVPRTLDLTEPLLRRLADHGADVQQVPTIAVEPPRSPQAVDRAIEGMVEGRFGWIVFTSPNAVRAIREKFEAWGLDARAMSGIRIAAVGAGTPDALGNWGLKPDLVPVEGQSTRDLAVEFPAHDELLDPIDRVLLPRAEVATELLEEGLSELGWQVEEVIAYRTVRASPPPVEVREAIKTGQFDAVVFPSSSTVRNLVGIAGKPHAVSVIAAIGPQTADACHDHGLRVDVEPQVPSMIGVVDALAAWADKRRRELEAAGKPAVRPSQKSRRGRVPAAVKRAAAKAARVQHEH